MQNKLDKGRLTQIVTEGVLIEKEFVCEALPVALIGMNKELMSQYIDFVADRLLVALGCEKHYHVKNPFDWMETISLQCASSCLIFLHTTRILQNNLRNVFTPQSQLACQIMNASICTRYDLY